MQVAPRAASSNEKNGEQQEMQVAPKAADNGMHRLEMHAYNAR